MSDEANYTRSHEAIVITTQLDPGRCQVMILPWQRQCTRPLGHEGSCDFTYVQARPAAVVEPTREPTEPLATIMRILGSTIWEHTLTDAERQAITSALAQAQKDSERQRDEWMARFGKLMDACGWDISFNIGRTIDDICNLLRAASVAREDSERLDWWFRRGLTDSVCEGSVDLWWADEEDGDAVERVSHGTSVRDALDKAMRGEHE